MLNKKFMVFAIFIVLLLAVTVVNAADNDTSDVVSVDVTADDAVTLDQTNDVVDEEKISNENVNDNLELNDFDSSFETLNKSDEVSNSSDDEILSYVNNDDLLSASPPYNKYSVSVSDTTINYASGGNIVISVTPCSGYDYKYDFYLKVYDSSNNEKISKNYYSTTSTNKITHSINANQLNPGTYTIKLINYADKEVMSTAKLTVNSNLPSSAYSVSVSDTSIDYGSSGSIVMSIYSASSSYGYRYDFYLKVYNSDNVEKISQRYYSTSSASSKTYSVGPIQLSPGVYTIKIINNYDDVVMDTARLTVTSVPSSAYSVSVSDTSIKYGSSGSIVMSISPASYIYSYRYDFYLKVYDSNNVEKISQRYYSTSYDYSKTYSVGSTQLSPGVYTIKIINSHDDVVMDTARLTVTSVPSSAYSVSVSDTSIKYGSSGSIVMSISPASYSYSYRYDFYLKVYNSNNVEKISQRYYSTSSASSKTYSVGSTQLSPGVYTIKIINSQDDVVMDTAKLRVKLNTYVSAKDIQTTYGSSKNLIVTLKDNNGILIGKTVSVKLNGKTYSSKTNSKGQISIKIPANLASKKYIASIKFAGDDSYAASSKSVNVVVSKTTPKITVNSIIGYQGKNAKLTATVKNQLGNKLKNCIVDFKINGKTYKARTNSKGIATLKIKIPKSERDKRSINAKNGIVTKTTTYKKIYACTASVSGNNFESSSTKFKITSTNKKIERFKIINKQTKMVTIHCKANGIRKKTSGHYIFVILHEKSKKNKIYVAARDKMLQKYIIFSSRAHVMYNGEKAYPWGDKWIKSNLKDYTHYYGYEGAGDANKLYVTIKYNDYTYKKI